LVWSDRRLLWPMLRGREHRVTVANDQILHHLACYLDHVYLSITMCQKLSSTHLSI
jgi:hypothetical protein